MMTIDTISFNVALLGLCLCSVFVISESSDCKCPGPIEYYKELGCTPIFKNEGDCCAERYDCSNLNSLPKDKCYLNGHTYEIGEALKAEDAKPCDIGCFCRNGVSGPTFNCAVVDCFQGPTKPGCYRQNSAERCCPGEEVCPEKPEDRATCIVDGKTYLDGEYFQPANEPNKQCNCAPGYTGENVAPFCIEPKNTCGILLRHAPEIRENCVPTYYHSQSPQTDCSVAYRCQNDKDAVIERPADSSGDAKSATTETENPEMRCTFGNLTMKIGEELNQATDYSSVCMKCVCEVPPLPTCQRLPDEECDITKHPAFDDSR